EVRAEDDRIGPDDLDDTINVLLWPRGDDDVLVEVLAGSLFQFGEAPLADHRAAVHAAHQIGNPQGALLGQEQPDVRKSYEQSLQYGRRHRLHGRAIAVVEEVLEGIHVEE